MLKDMPGSMSMIREDTVDISSRDSQVFSESARPDPSGLFSLPDELISTCFEHAVDQDYEDGPFVSLKLSHISRRCRAVALGNARIWTTFLHDTCTRSLDFTEVCISRSKQLPLTVAFTFWDKKRTDCITASEFLGFLNDRVDLDRCRRVVVALICDLENNLEEFEEQIFVQEEQTGMVLPQHLGTFVFLSTVKPEYLEVRVDSDYNYVASVVDQQLSFLLDRTLLKTPLCRLRHLTLPKLLTLFEFTRCQVDSVSSLHFVLELKLDSKAINFLKNFPLLQELEVTITVYGLGCPFYTPGECITIPNINHLRVRLYLFYDPDDFAYHEAQLALIGCLFPDVIKLGLHLEFQSDLSYRRPLYRSEWDFRPPIDSLFPSNIRYPSLEYLSMTFKITDLLGRSTDEIGEKPIAAAVFPLRRLPSLKHLEISTDLQIIVSSLIPEYFHRKTMRFPSLQSLKIEGPRLKIQKWVGLVMLILKEQGKWETFEELVMPLGSEEPLFGTSGGVLNGEAIT